MAAATVLVRLNPAMTFVFVSGAGSDSTERGRLMWARVKGRTENAVLRMPFKAAFAFRPGVVQPLHGVRSRTAVCRVLYSLTAALLCLLLAACYSLLAACCSQLAARYSRLATRG